MSDIQVGEYVKVDDYKGVAFYVQELHKDCEKEGGCCDCDGDPTWAICVMVGDDRRHEYELDELTLISRDDFCGECGQIECTHDGLEREEQNI